MIIYKIRRSDGQYSKGSMRPKFGTKGKVWTSQGALSGHFAQFSDKEIKQYYDNCEIVEYEFSETELTIKPIPEYLEEVKQRRYKRELPRKIREVEESIKRRDAEIEAAKKILREAGIDV